MVKKYMRSTVSHKSNISGTKEMEATTSWLVSCESHETETKTRQSVDLKAILPATLMAVEEKSLVSALFLASGKTG